MSDFLTLDVTVRKRSIPAPPLSLSYATENLPTIGPYTIGAVDFDGVVQPLPRLFIPPLPVLKPTLTFNDNFQDASISVPVPEVDVTFPTLSIATTGVTIPVANVTISVVDPLGSELLGGDVDVDLDWRSFGGSVNVPSPSLSLETVYITKATFDPLNLGSDLFSPRPTGDPILDVTLPTIRVPSVRTDGLFIPEFDLPSIVFVNGVSLDGSVSIPDPGGIAVDGSLDVDGLADYVLDPIPADFLANPTQWAFFAVLDEAADNVTETVARSIRDVTEGFFELLMTDETKERLREQSGDN